MYYGCVGYVFPFLISILLVTLNARRIGLYLLGYALSSYSRRNHWIYIYASYVGAINKKWERSISLQYFCYILPQQLLYIDITHYVA